MFNVISIFFFWLIDVWSKHPTVFHNLLVSSLLTKLHLLTPFFIHWSSLWNWTTIYLSSYFKPVMFSSFWIILCHYIFIYKVIINKIFFQSSISTFAHNFELLLAPTIHCHAPHKANLHSKSTMYSCTIHTNENSIVYTCPLWMYGFTIKTFLIHWVLHAELKDLFRFSIITERKGIIQHVHLIY